MRLADIDQADLRGVLAEQASGFLNRDFQRR